MGDWTSNISKYSQKLLEDVAKNGAQSAAMGLSGMVGRECQITDPKINAINVTDIYSWLGSPEDEVVGVYLQVDADHPVQFMLLLPWQQALELADMLLDQPIGTTKTLNALSKSALAEVGNLTGSLFLNAVASVADISLRPSPPGVMIDMLGAILNILIASMDDINQHVLLFQTAFTFPEQHTKLDFWVIPAVETIQSLVASFESSHV